MARSIRSRVAQLTALLFVIQSLLQSTSAADNQAQLRGSDGVLPFSARAAIERVLKAKATPAPTPTATLPVYTSAHSGHVDYVVPRFVANQAVTVCPPATPIPCYNTNATQVTCCAGMCGAVNNPVATCYIAPATPKPTGKPASAQGAKVAVSGNPTSCSVGSPNPCYSWDGTQLTCCPGSCGTNYPSATCQGGSPAAQTPATPSTPSQPAPVSVPAGSTCPGDSPNPCYNWNGGRMTCCPGACGSVNNPDATCEGAPPTTQAVAQPQTPVTPDPTPAQTQAAPVTAAPVQTNPIPTNPPPTDPPATQAPVPTDPPATQAPVPTDPPATQAPVPTDPPATLPPVIPNPIQTDSVLPAAPGGFQWVVNSQLSDEFDGNALDGSKWRATHPYWSGRLPSQFNPNNVAVSGGYAQLVSTTNVNDMSQVGDPGNSPWISSAVISSNSAIAGFGYYEAKMKASDIAMTSSFWFQGGRTEIDVIETMGIPSDYRSRYMPINTHYYPSGISPNTPDYHVGTNYRIPSGLTSDGFHTYGVWWKDAQTLIFYFDGQQVWQMTPAGPFTDSMYLFFDTECFANEAMPTVSDLKDYSKNTFLIDHVRAFTLQPL